MASPMIDTDDSKPGVGELAIEFVEHTNDITAIRTVDVDVNATEHIVYGKAGLSGLAGSPYVLGAAFLASMGGFSFGYDQGVISIVNVMDQFHDVFPKAETAFGKGLMTCMLEFGAFIGCFFMPTLADKISRKWALTFVVVIFNIGAIMQTAAPSYAVLVAGRTIGGIGVGTLAMGAPIYICEIAPPHLRGTLLVLEELSIVCGIIIAFWITYGTRNMVGDVAFRLPFGLQMVCSTILGIGIHFYPFSPRWLALVDRSDEAMQSLVRLRRLPDTDPRVQAEHRGILAEVAVQRAMQIKRHPKAGFIKRELIGWVDLFRSKTRRRTYVAIGVAFFQQFSGINAFIYYAPTLFQSLGQTSEMALIMSGIFNVLQLVAVAVCFTIIDRLGRRPLAILGAAGGAVAWAIMAILSGLYSQDWLANPAAGWSAVAMAFLFILMFGVSYAPLGWALPAEVYPNASRSKGVALSTATNWLCNFIIGLITPPMIENWGFGTYVFFAAWCALAVVWAFFIVPETKGKTLEEMDAVFGDDATREEKEALKAYIISTQQLQTGGVVKGV